MGYARRSPSSIGTGISTNPTDIWFEGMRPMKAVILAGGKGSRLYPYSATLPKPLMPLGNMPVLELLLRQFRLAGIQHAILAVNHMRHLIEAFFGDGSRLGVTLEYNREDHPLGTAGPLGTLLDRLGEEFVLANGDLLTDLDVARMIAAHRSAKADATVGVFEREVKVDFGLIDVDDAMRMIGYREKPSQRQLVSMGLYVLRAAAIRPFVRPNEYLDVPELMGAMMQAGHLVLCHRQDCFWLDIGRPEDLATAQRMFEREPERFLMPRS
jgi:NDP-sugar pyrophosphorylase family protein